ncbi:MAG: acetyltransferase [Burkholderiaceae bacterium]|jgi:putative acetyltransferase|nr:acetyltransferase [Burkholderiaceae bacterium]
MTIRSANPGEFDQLAAIWEASVRASHGFLGEADIAALRPLVRHDYLPAVTLRVYADAADRPVGFLGVADGKVEMLFIAPDAQGQGVGGCLVRHAVEVLGCGCVDVNEQNPRAVRFYRYMGFVVRGRSALDGQGRPFPLLHMALGEAGLPRPA